MMQLFIGYDERESLQYMVAAASARQHATTPVRIRPVWMRDLQRCGFYSRPTIRKPTTGVLTDLISCAPMATSFALARFFMPFLATPVCGLVAFVDCDVMFRRPVNRLFEAHTRGKAVSVVKHDYRPVNRSKMDAQPQSVYPRKNWSSVMVWDLDHPKVQALSLEYLNRTSGLDLHSFAWLEDDDIGELPPEWNHLVGHSKHPDPALVHWTEGAPCMVGYEDAEYADDFWRTLERALA